MDGCGSNVQVHALAREEEKNFQANPLRLKQPLLFVPGSHVNVITFYGCHDMNVGSGMPWKDKPGKFRDD